MSISQQTRNRQKNQNKQKQKRMKKLFTLIVAICATTLAWADASGKCGENVTYSFVSSTGTLTISGTGAMKDYNNTSAPWYYLSIEKVVINNGVTSIGEYAFEGCTGLTSVTIPNSVTSIGDLAFYECTGLTSIYVAEDNLNYASIDGVLYSKDKKTLIKCPEGKTGSVTIPNSVTSIGKWAFYNCYGQTSVTIPNSVTSIGLNAFVSCTGLTSMTVEATNPPLCDNLGMSDISLYVPAGSIDAYKAADEWKKFTNIQAIPATGVKEATAEKREVKKIIDRNGIIYIEKDGTRYFLNGDKVE